MSGESRSAAPPTTEPTPSATITSEAQDPLVATVIEYVTARTLLDHADPATLTRFQAVVDEELGRLGRDLWEIENVPDGTAELSSAQSFTAALSGKETAHFVEACIRFIEAPAPMRYVFVLDPSETSPTGWIIAGSSVEAPCELEG